MMWSYHVCTKNYVPYLRHCSNTYNTQKNLTLFGIGIFNCTLNWFFFSLVIVDKQKYIEDRLEQESQASPGKLPSDGTIRRASLPQPLGSMELGPCCTGQIEQKTPKPVGGPELGPCCAGKVDNESPPECAGMNWSELK